MAVEKGGFWSNPVDALRLHLPEPGLRQGLRRARQDAEHAAHLGWRPRADEPGRRHALLVAVHVDRAAIGNTVDCVTDENVRPIVDKQGNYSVVVSRAIDRPANATEKCGVTWMEYGNGDGIPGGSTDYGAVINRHTLVNPKFQNSWFDVKKVRGEAEALGAYLPQVINLHDKARFEALGCPVDTSKFSASTKS